MPPTRARLAFMGSLLLAGIAAGCGADPPPPAAPPRPVVDPTPAEPAGWQPIAAPPVGSRHARWSVETPAGALRADPGGMRWLVPKKGKAEHAASFDEAEPRLVTWIEGRGLVAIDRAFQVVVAPRALDAFTTVGAVPRGARDHVHVHRGALTAEGAEGVFSSTDGESWRELAGLGDRRVSSAIIGGDGRGIALFAPQALGRTEDFGRTWLPLDDGGTLVTTLRAERDRVAVEPAPSLAYARVWSPGKATLDRSDGEGEGDPSVIRPGSFGIGGKERLEAAPAPGEVRRYLGLADRLHEGEAALDGDTFVTADTLDRNEVYLAIGKLGAGVTWRIFPEASSAPCAGRNASHRVALCRDRVAITCEDKILIGELPLSDKGGAVTKVREIATVGTPRSVAFAGEDRLFSATREGVVEIAIDDKSPRSRPVPIEADRGKIHWEHPQIVASCAPITGAPPAWIFDPDNHALYRHDGSRFARWTGKLPDKARIEAARGLDPSGNVLLSLSKGELAIASSDDTLEEIALTWKPLGRAWLGTLPQGRGVLLDDRGQARQTEDGGRTWALVADPPKLAHKGKPGVVCGGDRCEIDDRAVRVGWSREGAPAERGEPPPKPKGARRSTPPPCTPEPARDVRLDDKRGSVVLLTPAWRGAGWTAITSLTGDKTVKLSAASLGAGGKLTVRALAESPAEYAHTGDSGGLRTLLAPIAGAAVITGAGDPQRGMPASILWDPGGSRLVTVKTRAASVGFHHSFIEQIQSALLADDGVAIVETSPAVIRWLHEDGRVETRDFPTVDYGRLGPDFRGGIARARDGTWVIAMSATEINGGVTGDPRLLHLLAVAPDHTRRARRLWLTGSTPAALGGVALVEEGDRISAALVEQVGPGEAEVRLREISGDLRLGAARPVPGSRMALDRIGALPACGAQATGARMIMRDDTWTRLVRVTPQRACAERTWNDDLLLIEGAGNGEGVRAEGSVIRGVRCQIVNEP